MKPQNPKILMIITVFSIGGATETVITLCKGLIKRGYDVTIFTGQPIPSEGDLIDVARKAQLKVIVSPNLKRNIHPIRDLLAFLQLLKIIKAGQYDIVHTHSSKAGILGRLAAKFAGVRYMIHTIHGLPFHSYQNPIIRYLFLIAEKLAAQITHRLIAVSNKIISDSLKYHVGKKEQFVMVRSGFETTAYQDAGRDNQELKQKLGLNDGDFILGKISRLSRLKGHSKLLKVMPILKKEFPNVKLIFVGDGEIREQLKREVSFHKLNNVVIFTGTIQPSDIPLYISLMDVVIHTSLHEGLPRVIPQALLMGKPVISYNIDGAPEVINNNFNGLLIDPSDENELIEAVRKIAKNYEIFKKNCSLSRNKIESEFCEVKMVNDTCNIYSQILGR